MNLPPYEGIFACLAILLSTYDVKFINIEKLILYIMLFYLNKNDVILNRKKKNINFMSFLLRKYFPKK